MTNKLFFPEHWKNASDRHELGCWGGGMRNKLLAVQTRGPEFGPQNPSGKLAMVMRACNASTGEAGRQIWMAH